jgi:hypothetical protein
MPKTETTSTIESTPIHVDTLAGAQEIDELVRRRADVSEEIAATRVSLTAERALALQRAADWRTLDQDYGAEVRRLDAVEWDALAGLIQARELHQMKTLVHEMTFALTEVPRQMDGLVSRIDGLTYRDIETRAIGAIKFDVYLQRDDPRPRFEDKLRQARALLANIRQWLQHSPKAAAKSVILPAFTPDAMPVGALAPAVITTFDPLA